jgi:hypothetical protein
MADSKILKIALVGGGVAVIAASVANTFTGVLDLSSAGDYCIADGSTPVNWCFSFGDAMLWVIGIVMIIIGVMLK